MTKLLPFLFVAVALTTSCMSHDGREITNTNPQEEKGNGLVTHGQETHAGNGIALKFSLLAHLLAEEQGGQFYREYDTRGTLQDFLKPLSIRVGDQSAKLTFKLNKQELTIPKNWSAFPCHEIAYGILNLYAENFIVSKNKDHVAEEFMRYVNTGNDNEFCFLQKPDYADKRQYFSPSSDIATEVRSAAQIANNLLHIPEDKTGFKIELIQSYNPQELNKISISINNIISGRVKIIEYNDPNDPLDGLNIQTKSSENTDPERVCNMVRNDTDTGVDYIYHTIKINRASWNTFNQARKVAFVIHEGGGLFNIFDDGYDHSAWAIINMRYLPLRYIRNP